MVGSLNFFCISHTAVPVLTVLELTIYVNISNVPAGETHKNFKLPILKKKKALLFLIFIQLYIIFWDVL
jgi:hypothetical protein